MRFHANTNVKVITWFVVGLSVLALAGFTGRAVESTAVNDIETVLDNYNLAATNADIDKYFACFAPDAVFLGTDATERWTVDELRAFVKPYFDQGISRTHTPQVRHINFCTGGAESNVAFFDELVAIEGLGVCRGMGVVVKLDDQWLITQYGLSFPVPNDIALDVVNYIQDYSNEQGNTKPDDDETSIREVLAAYLSAATFPDPKPIDPELFTAEIVALWSNGKKYSGRDSVVKALEKSQRALEGAFKTFSATAEQVSVQRRGNVAWLTCNIKMNGTLMEDGKQFTVTVQSTFVFVQKGNRWRIANEHSSKLVAAGEVSE